MSKPQMVPDREHGREFNVLAASRGEPAWSKSKRSLAPTSTGTTVMNSEDLKDTTPDDHHEAGRAMRKRIVLVEVATVTEARRIAPWAAKVIGVEGGYLAFWSREDARMWKRRRTSEDVRELAREMGVVPHRKDASK